MTGQEFSKNIRAFIAQHEMIRSGDKVCVAVSGGADSVCLLHLLASLRDELEFSLSFVHINHCLRADESDGDASFAEELCRELNVPGHVIRKPAEEWLGSGENLQDAARDMRYRLFAELAKREGYNRIATAHTASDQAETILLRMISGTGLRGLGGIPPVRDDLFIRPLLQTSREQLLTYLNEHGISWREDSSNSQRKYDRNKVRLDVLPVLRELNPRVEEALVRLSENASEDERILYDLTISFCDKHLQQDGESFLLPVVPVKALETGLRNRLYREVVSRMSGSDYGISALHCRRMDEVASCDPAGQRPEVCSLPQDLELRNEGEFLRLISVNEQPLPEVSVNHVGDFNLGDYGYRLVISRVDQVPEKPWPGHQLYILEKQFQNAKVRASLPGDRMQIEGMEGSKKLQDLFVDAKIPLYKRRRWPILELDGEVAWVIGLRRNGRFVADSGASNVLLITAF